jgi:signal transduction histidine kinase
MRTLSARILLGFAALTITFAVITATVVVNMQQVEDEILVIRKGYVPLAMISKELERRQESLRNYLEELSDAPNANVAQRMLSRVRGARDTAVTNSRHVLEVLDGLDVDSHMTVSRRRIEVLQTTVTDADGLYRKVMAAPPLVHADGTPLDPRQVDASDALVQLRTAERRIAEQVKQLAEGLENSTYQNMATLESGQSTLRIRTIYLGIAAIALALLTSIWGVITLRPLRRLRDAARRVAAGDYASRIDVRGPSEVADLARELNSMAAAVQERERELVRSERLAAVGKMAAQITHEVRNPLSSIGLNTELLEEELLAVPNADEARALCRAITFEVDRLTAITEEYLAFGRLPKSKLAPESVNPMVTALVTFVREDLAAKKVELACELAPGDPVAMVDAAQLRQCLVNLVRNASEAVASNHGGKVTLRTRQVGVRVEISVEDDGVGIPADVLPRLFDPFFSTKDQGSGLGLALTQQIVKDHGGDLTVASTVGKGTTFTVSVPAGK